MSFPSAEAVQPGVLEVAVLLSPPNARAVLPLLPVAVLL